jgi:hypothetical protein
LRFSSWATVDDSGARSKLTGKDSCAKTRTHFAHSTDMLDAAGELCEHLAGVEDYLLAEALSA